MTDTLPDAEQPDGYYAYIRPVGKGPKPEPEPASEPATRPAARTKTVRNTVDLPIEVHHGLKAWLNETAFALGRSRATAQDAITAAVQVLLEDEAMAQRVRAKLQEDDEHSS